jgi:phage/plasmid-associated DNA primase
MSIISNFAINDNGKTAFTENISENATTTNPVKFQVTSVLKKGLNSSHNIRDWETIEGFDSYFRCRKNGLGTRLCVKDLFKSEKGNSKIDISCTAGFYIDCDTGMSIAEFREHELYEYVSIIQPSSSWKGDDIDSCDRWHATLIFDVAQTDTSRHEVVSESILKGMFLKTDTSVFDAGRVAFSSKNPPILINREARLPFEDYYQRGLIYLESIKDLKLPKVPKAENKPAIGAQRAAKINNLIGSQLPKIESDRTLNLNNWVADLVRDRCDGNWCEFFNSYYDFNFKPRTNDKVGGDDSIEKWEGMNPFSDTNTSGSSFTFSVLDNDRIVWFARSGNADVVTIDGEIKNGGSVIDFVYLFKKSLHQYQHGTAQDNLNAVIYGMARDFDYEPPKLNVGINWLAQQVCRDLKSTLKVAEWGEISASESFQFYYKNGNDIFKQYCLKKISINLASHSEENYPDACLSIMENTKKFKGFPVAFQNWFSNNEPDLEVYNERPEPNWRFIPFQNGLYDLVEKKLIPNNGEGLNSKKISFDYREIDSNHIGIKAFKEWINFWIGEGFLADYLRDYAIACWQGNAWQITTFPCIYGKSETGKSTYGETIKYIFPTNMGLVLSDSRLPINSNSQHGTAELEGKFLWTMEEIKQTENSDLNNLLSLFGKDSDKRISINPKGQECREIKKYFGLICDSELIPQLPKSKEGLFRRMRFFNSFKSTDVPKILDLLEIIRKYREEIYCWALQQNFDSIKKNIDEIASNEYFKSQAEEIQKDNDDLSGFISEVLIITNDLKDKLDTDAIYVRYQEWCIKDGYKALNKKSFMKYIIPKLTDHNAWKKNEKTFYESSGKRIMKGLLINCDFYQKSDF